MTELKYMPTGDLKAWLERTAAERKRLAKIERRLLRAALKRLQAMKALRGAGRI